MVDVFIAAATRTPFGRYGGRLAALRCDDLAAAPITSLMARYPTVDWGAVDEVVLGCANQAGEDNRNVARMATLLSGLPETVPAVTVNRLCASGLEAVGQAARAIAGGDAEFVIAGGVESMSRAPFVMPKAEAAFTREQKLEDSTLGWHCINPVMQVAVRRRFDDANRGQPRSRTRHYTRLPGRICIAQPAAHCARTGGRLAGRRDHCSANQQWQRQHHR